MKKNFAHLHVHSVYSLLDGYSPIPELLDEVKKLGMDSIAITDHGNMHGVVEFYKEAKKRNINPIIGCEIYTAFSNHRIKDSQERENYHLILLAENQKGLKNLMEIVSEAYIHGFYYRPRIDKDYLRAHSEGLIATSACLGGEIPQYILDNNIDKAKEVALEYLDIFGKGNFFIELQDHGMREQKMVNQILVQISVETGIPLIAANDVHYIKREDAKIHDALLCLQTGKTLDDQDRMKFEGDQFYLKSPDEMAEIFPNLPEALENTIKIADRCSVEFDFETLHLPGFESPDEFTNEEYLNHLVSIGLEEKYENLNEEIKLRANFELETIISMGYIDYFLIVWDFVRYAKSKNIIVGPGRGSAAGSIVSYALGITNIDPIKYDLFFERFLNPERVSMPDIDIDFCYERREEVIQYVIDKYGEDHVAQIITFGTLGARAAIRDIGRVLGLPYDKVDNIAKTIPTVLNITIKEALDMSSELKNVYDSDPEIRELINIALEVEGIPRHSSTHAAGVVISKDPITNYVPLSLNGDAVTTQFTMKELEELGLLKMDFLGLRTLTVIQDAVAMIKENTGEEVNLENIDLEDKNVLKLFHDAETIGIFQFESQGMREFLKILKSNQFEDLIAANSLFRPGPMDEIKNYVDTKHNPENIKYLDERLIPILEPTYGIIVYQEQVMEIVQEIGGFSLGDADLLRRAMGDKDREIMLREKTRFVHGDENACGAIANGMDEKTANKIYDLMSSFADYAFNKSHSAAYALIAFQTAYLKTYYPVEYMAALLSSVIGDSKKISFYLNEAKRMGIEILAPDINKSELKFTVEDNKIRFAFLAIKSLGTTVIEKIIDVRLNDEFSSLRNFIERMYDRRQKIQKKALENLIWGGAFDSIHDNRAELINIFEMEMDAVANSQKNNLLGQFSFFEEKENNYIPKRTEFSRNILLAREKEVLGLYLSGHPLEDYQKIIKNKSNFSTLEFNELSIEEKLKLDGKNVNYVGMISYRNDILTKKNKPMAFLRVEDLFSETEIIVFPNLFGRVRHLLSDDSVVSISGKLQISDNDDLPKIIADNIISISEIKESPGTLFLRLDSKKDEMTKKVLKILEKYPGPAELGLYFKIEKERVIGKNFRIDGESKDLFMELSLLIGKDNVVWIENVKENF